MRDMDMDSFVAMIQSEIGNYLPPHLGNAEVTINKVTKNNDQQLTGLMIKTEDTNIAPNIYLEGYFEQYQDGKDIEDIVRDIADVRVQHEMSQDFDVSKLTDFDQVKDHIICKLVNAEMNKDYLADKPFTPVEDLAVIYAVDLGMNECGKMTAPITNVLMEQYGITTQKLHAIALRNLAESQIELKTMRETMIEIMFPEGIDEDDPRVDMIPPEEALPPLYVLSNQEKLGGAATLLDKKTMDDISERFDGNFVIIPSSIHEVLIFPDRDADVEELKDMVACVNTETVPPEEVLSSNVYTYDKDNGLKIAA